MKKSLIVLFVLFLSVSLMAQIRTGNIRGKVTDTEGTALPGVSVTLSAPILAPITSITTEGGSFRFVSLSAGSEYTLTAELTGFKKQIKSGIIVTIGSESEINLVMEVGKLEEEVTVTAVTPVVDAKKTAVGKNVSQEVLQSLPSARDPWVVLEMTPGIVMDRENVGGTESGQQSGYIAKGDASGGSNGVWALDGVVVTDPSAIGASPAYWDFDSFEEMNVVTGGADVTVQTGGVALNMVTRRGGNKVSLGGRFYYTDNYFQATNLTDALKAEGATRTNQINNISDYGFNIGGPILKDKIWLWGSYGVQKIDGLTFFGGPTKPTLTQYNAKLNLQLIPENRLEIFYNANSKVYKGRSSTHSNPQGVNQSSPYHFGNPILKIQDEHMFGDNLLVSLKFAYMDAAFQLLPALDEQALLPWSYDVYNDLGGFAWGYYITTRPMYDYNAYVNYFNDSLFGASHDIKLGVEYSTRRVTTDWGFAGNLMREYDLTVSDCDFNGDGVPDFTPGMNEFYLYTHEKLDTGVKQLAAFVSDTVSFGRFNLLLGLRYDRQTPQINASTWDRVQPTHAAWTQQFDQTAINAFDSFVKPLSVTAATPSYSWDVFSPRIGLTYDLFGTGKTLLKLNFAMYGDFLGTGFPATYFYPLGTWGNFYFFWNDLNGDGIANYNELFWPDPDTYAPVRIVDDSGNFNAAAWNAQKGIYVNSFEDVLGQQSYQYLVDSNAGSSRTIEYLATIEHELLTDFNLGLDFTYRRYDNMSWDVNRSSVDASGVDRSQADYMQAGTVPTVPGVDMGAGAGQPWYVLNAAAEYMAYSHHKANSNYYGFWGLDFVFNKRLSNNWMVDGSISYMDQWRHYASDGYNDPTTLWALQDNVWAPQIGSASGKINQYIFSHWMFKLEGLYQLPLGFDISFTFNARAGHMIPHYMYLNDSTLPNAMMRTNLVYLDKLGSEMLDTYYQLNLRLEKMIKIGDSGRIYLMADAFNVLNSATVLSRYDRREGSYYIASAKFVPYTQKFKIYEILNPFVARFGIRFQI